jgi:hypothetical protein
MADTSKTAMPAKNLNFITAALLLMIFLNSFYFAEHFTSFTKKQVQCMPILFKHLKNAVLPIDPQKGKRRKC